MKELRKGWNVFRITKRPNDSWRLFGRLLPQPMIGSFQTEWDFKKNLHFTIATPESGMRTEIKVCVQPIFHVGVTLFCVILNPIDLTEEIAEFKNIHRIWWGPNNRNTGASNATTLLCKVNYPMNSEHDKGSMTIYAIPNRRAIAEAGLQIEEVEAAIPRVPLNDDEDLLERLLEVDRLWQKQELAQKSPATVTNAVFDPATHVKHTIAMLARKHIAGRDDWSLFVAMLWYLVDRSHNFIEAVSYEIQTSTATHILREFLMSDTLSIRVETTINATMRIANPDCDLTLRISRSTVNKERWLLLLDNAESLIKPKTLAPTEQHLNALRAEILKQFPTSK